MAGLVIGHSANGGQVDAIDPSELQITEAKSRRL